MAHMSQFDSPLLLGFDQIERLLDRVGRSSSDGYPPYNIELLCEDKYRISMAVAGFSKDDVTIEVLENALTVAGKKEAEESQDEEQKRQFLHKGISERNFERKFHLGDHVKVTGADLEHGLLNIDLEREIPEEKKPRQIEIGSALLENKQ